MSSRGRYVSAAGFTRPAVTVAAGVPILDVAKILGHASRAEAIGA
jgi:hypothetical protein